MAALDDPYANAFAGQVKARLGFLLHPSSDPLHQLPHVGWCKMTNTPLSSTAYLRLPPQEDAQQAAGNPRTVHVSQPASLV